MRESRTFPCVPFGLAPILLAACLGGCGEGERMQTGTQTNVSNDMLEEARAQDAYFDSLKKAAKKAAPEKSTAPQPGATEAPKDAPK